MITEERLINHRDIPSTLLSNNTKTLIIPEILSEAYKHTMKVHGLVRRRNSYWTGPSSIGGESTDLAQQHFVHRFDGSVARAQMALLDPKNDLKTVSSTIIAGLAGNRVTLIDVPCGACAASLSFLCCIAELREKGTLPRTPLDVLLLGGEISGTARGYGEMLLSRVHSDLVAQAIFVDHQIMHWDATCPISNSDLIKEINVASITHPGSFLVTANFSGFLTNSGKWREAEPQIRDLFLHTSRSNGTAVWIEPDTNRATKQGGLLPKLMTLIKGAWKLFVRQNINAEESDSVLRSSSNFKLLLQTDEVARVKLAIIPIDVSRLQ